MFYECLKVSGATRNCSALGVARRRLVFFRQHMSGWECCCAAHCRSGQVRPGGCYGVRGLRLASSRRREAPATQRPTGWRPGGHWRRPPRPEHSPRMSEKPQGPAGPPLHRQPALPEARGIIMTAPPPPTTTPSSSSRPRPLPPAIHDRDVE